MKVIESFGGSVSDKLEIYGIASSNEFASGDSISQMIFENMVKFSGIQNHDLFVITQKIVSKSESRTMNLNKIEPSLMAIDLGLKTSKDPRLVQLILDESKEIIRIDELRGILITETNQGFICANAGIDSSNVPGDPYVTLLPIDSDVSAQNIRQELIKKSGIDDLAVIISDTFGRPWREGHMNFAIGSSGINPFIDYSNSVDSVGKLLKVTKIAIADEFTAASKLVTGKVDMVPVVLIRGARFQRSDSAKISHTLRDKENDLFR